MSEGKAHPYDGLPPQAFWRSGVAEAGVFGLKGLWQSRWSLPQDARFATFGSCFAQHISRALRGRRMGWVNGEPAPAGTPPALAAAYNYNVFSARTANIYTAAQLRWLLEAAAGLRDGNAAEVWPGAGGRWYDSLRPAIEPEGFASVSEALASRRAMLRALANAVRGCDVFVFTLGLTEGWEHAGGQPYAACPGTLAGQFDPAQHRFCNYRHGAIRADLDAAFAVLRGLNPALHLLLTVSPVPLTATASGQHVLLATTQSKAVLRSVAGEFAADEPLADYFPSYEVITGAPARGTFFAPNLRSVEQAGVDLVMGHFFAGLQLGGPARHGAEAAAEAQGDTALEQELQAGELACEEAMLESFNHAR